MPSVKCQSFQAQVQGRECAALESDSLAPATSGYGQCMQMTLQQAFMQRHDALQLWDFKHTSSVRHKTD
jgi:hypothetical protein